ncbi:MAG: hypothetical protein CL908_22040 [Deltaproteobacteria bacterium]|nr:hypothetical protein [Deltaproteobacteria bacterium]
MTTGWGRARIVVLGVVLAALQFGCAVLQGSPRVPPEQRAAYDSAMGNLPADLPAAERALEAFLVSYPQSLLADDALEQLAELAFADGRQEQGMRLLGRILRDHAEADRAAPARLRLAQIEYGRDKRVAARRLLDPLELDELTRVELRAALRLHVALSQTPVERLDHLSALRAVLADEISARRGDPVVIGRLQTRMSAVDREMGEHIDSAASAELETLLRRLRKRVPAPMIALELARRALDAGQFDLAADRLDRAESLARNELERGQVRLLNERLAARREMAQLEADLPALRELADRPRPQIRGARGTVGVVLPLSGDFANFGQESLRGILLAADVFDQEESEATHAGYPDEALDRQESIRRARQSEIRLVVRDSRGDPVVAAAMVRELADDPSLLAIVGPIFSAESLGAAEAAQEAGVPLVTLSAREEVPDGRSQVFRTRTTPADEVALLVSHAFEEIGAERFAVLYPRTRYGRGMRKLYWDAVVERGGMMVAASSYDSEATDFSTAIRDMIGYRFLTDWERKALAERDDILRSARRLPPQDAALLREAAYSVLGPERDPLPPIVDFDVLFIPDASETIAMIAPGLAFHEIRDVRLLGSNEWLDDELLRVARQHVSGSVVSTAFYPESDVPFVVDFVDRFERTFASSPDAYAAQAFDATNLILLQMSSGRSSRRSVRDGLLDVRAYPGATGVLTMRPDGNARRRPFLLGVSGGRFRPLD